MKHFGLSISLLLLGGFISSISSQELESRLKFYKPDKFRAAVHSLQQKYKTTYQPAKGWEEAIEELESNRIVLIDGIRKGDKKTIRQAEGLLHTLDATLLANPLIQKKQITAIRRTLGDKARTAIRGDLGIVPNNFHIHPKGGPMSLSH